MQEILIYENIKDKQQSQKILFMGSYLILLMGYLYNNKSISRRFIVRNVFYLELDTKLQSNKTSR